MNKVILEEKVYLATLEQLVDMLPKVTAFVGKCLCIYTKDSYEGLFFITSDRIAFATDPSHFWRYPTSLFRVEKFVDLEIHVKEVSE